MKGYSLTIDPTIDDYAGAINEGAGLVASATGTFAAAYAAGTSTVNLAGFTASATLTAGSKVFVPGDPAPYLTGGDITADGAGALASVVLSRGLLKGVASGSPVTVSHDICNIDGLESAATYDKLRFTIAGDAQVYTMTHAATTSSNAADFRFRPGLKITHANNDVVTFLPPTLTNAADGVAGIVSFSVSGIAGGAVLTPEGTVNGTTWNGLGVVPFASTTMATTISADGGFRMDATGLQQTRLRITTAGTGTITVQVQPTIG